MTRNIEAYVRKVLDGGSFGYFPPDFKWVRDMDPDEEYERFAAFRESSRLRLPFMVDNFEDRFPYDLLEREKMLNDLKARKRQPAQGLWFDEDACQMCGIENDRLVQDHCHFTGVFRGMLCYRCNQREGIDNDPKWRAWRLLAPGTTRPNRWVYRRECNDCSDETIATTPWFLLVDYHRWVQAETYFVLADRRMQ